MTIMPTNESIKENNWLSSYSRNVASQYGEDGILEKVFNVIKGDKWCVEFGAVDGKYSSNTWNLIKNKKWSSIQIESNKKAFKKLVETYKDRDNVVCLNEMVCFSGINTLDNILRRTPIPQHFDLISIDVDGNDYHIWNSIKYFQPKVVIVEFNPTIPNDMEFVQQRNMKINHGTSLLSLTKLGKKKGYELVATTMTNCIFVKQQYFELFNIKNNSLNLMYNGREFQTGLFQLFDGTLIVYGCKKLLWHGIKITNKKIQILPRYLRKYYNNYPLILRKWYKIRKRLIALVLRLLNFNQKIQEKLKKESE